MKNKSFFFLTAAIIASTVIFGCARNETATVDEQPSMEANQLDEQPSQVQPGHEQTPQQTAPKTEQAPRAAVPMAPKQEIKVTFVELGSVNCIPCKMMQPVMADIEKEYGDQVKVVFHDVWTQEGEPFGKQYNIRAIPTQVFLDKDGKEFFRHQGFFPKEEVVKVLQSQGVK